MSIHPPFAVHDIRLLDRRRCSIRVVDGMVSEVGAGPLGRPGDAVIDGGEATLLPGLIDAHVHLVPGCSALAPLAGVTTQIDLFSKLEVIAPERALLAASRRGAGPVCADLRTSGVGATAPGGHPTIAYSPIPYVDGPAEAADFVTARVEEGVDHLKIVYDDGSGAMLGLPTLTPETIEALVAAARFHGLLTVAHASTAAGASLVARFGVDVLAHVPHDRLSPAQVGEIADGGAAVIATLSILDGFPDAEGVMPLLTSPIAERIPPRPDGTPARANVGALHRAGVRILAGTDAPNPGLLHGASLHRELEHLVAAGLSPHEALLSATSVPADVFGLVDRGRVQVGSRADLLLVHGDPVIDISATQRIHSVWVGGRLVRDEPYQDSGLEAHGLAWLQDSTDKIVRAIAETWPDLPGPEDVVREDGEVVGRLVPGADGWQATTVFGARLGDPGDHDDVEAEMLERGLSSLAEPWSVRVGGTREWRDADLVEVEPTRVRLRWRDPGATQPAGGTWLDVSEISLRLAR